MKASSETIRTSLGQILLRFTKHPMFPKNSCVGLLPIFLTVLLEIQPCCF